MGSRKISQLTEKATPVDDDLIVIVDSEGTPGTEEANKGVKISSLIPQGQGTISGNIPVVLDPGETIGKYKNGDVIPSDGWTLDQFAKDIATKFLVPEFTSFNIVQNSPIEVGTEIGGVGDENRDFTWATSNPGNVTPNSIQIEDVTGATIIGSGLANTGSANLAIGAIQNNTEASNQWRITLQDEAGGSDNLSKSILWRYIIFYGATSSDPSNSVEVRSLPDDRFTSESNTFILNTGTTEVKFAICLPPGKSIVQIIDLDAANTPVTNDYVLTGAVPVLDAGGNNVNYNVYVLTLQTPYTSNHRHQITLS